MKVGVVHFFSILNNLICFSRIQFGKSIGYVEIDDHVPHVLLCIMLLLIHLH